MVRIEHIEKLTESKNFGALEIGDTFMLKGTQCIYMKVAYCAYPYKDPKTLEAINSISLLTGEGRAYTPGMEVEEVDIECEVYYK